MYDFLSPFLLFGERDTLLSYVSMVKAKSSFPELLWVGLTLQFECARLILLYANK